MLVFIQKVEITGVNPSVEIPDKVMQQLFKQSGRDKAPLPVSGIINGKPFKQKIIKHQGRWLMYLNTEMRSTAHIRVGETITIAIEYSNT